MISNHFPKIERPSKETEESTVYYLAFRLHSTHPWRSQEFCNRYEAQNRYKTLKHDGYEAYLESRRRACAA